MKRANKQKVLDLLSKIFSDGSNNLALAIGYGVRTSYFGFACLDDDGTTEFSPSAEKYLKNSAQYSATDYANGIIFYSDYLNKDVISLGQLLPELDEDKLIIICNKNDVGNDFWDAVVCINTDGDIVIHSVRHDGMVAPNRCTVMKLGDYTK